MLDQEMIAARIGQISFDDPVEHDWVSEEDAVLIELVRNFVWAPDLAGSALSELSGREHEAAGEWCLFLLSAKEADRMALRCMERISGVSRHGQC